MLGKYPNVCATHCPNLNQDILSFAVWVVCIVSTSLALRLAPKARDIDENADAQPLSIEEQAGIRQQASLSEHGDLTFTSLKA